MQIKFLIVDDERQLVRFLRQALLIEFPACEVDAAYSGEEGLSRLAQATYSLILADVHMPGFDGLNLVKGVRYWDPDVPIVLMTGFGSQSTRQEAVELGVSYYVDKPFELSELMGIVRRLLENTL